MIANSLGMLALALCGGYGPSPEELAVRAISGDPKVAQPAVRALRAMGPAGLEAFVKAHGKALESPTPAVAAAIDAIGMQKDNFASRLYWYTDLDLAKAAASVSGKPILSLRLLGNLDEDLSCANSRFFRTALYADPEISKLLRESFVLHWRSVRPVPKITIEMGDGRKLVRTVTGNSIHYVLEPGGTLIDGIPGLYGSKAFSRQLRNALEVYARFANPPFLRNQFVRIWNFHRMRLGEIQAAWEEDLRGIGATAMPALTAEPASDTPTANDAAPLAVSKARVEAPVLAAYSDKSLSRLEQSSNEDAWGRIASLHLDEAKLSPASEALIRRKTPTLKEAELTTEAKRLAEDPLARLIANFERSISEDTVRNEYLFHSKIYRWLLESPHSDVEDFNERVYAELFLTHGSDPWLGLLPADTYAALDGCGVVE